MLDTDSSRLVIDPALNHKSDSVSFGYGVMQAMQQLADQYFFQNEMRGELVSPTSDATTHLQNLSNYTAGTENKYDSVYLYYKVINNCNYYLQHRDTTLMTGTDSVTVNEYANIAAFRAWTYLQLTTQYGDVPYITKPMTTISEINAATAKSDYHQILADQAAYMQSLKNRYSIAYLDPPTYIPANTVLVGGHLNSSNSINKTVSVPNCFVPFNVVLGDLYLELGQYEQAAKCYFDYLNHEVEKAGDISAIDINNCNALRMPMDRTEDFELPLDFNTSGVNMAIWANAILGGAGDPTMGYETISYIPMAVNYTKGQTTEVPMAFGYDFYATTDRQVSTYRHYRCPQTNVIQVVPSAEYNEMAYHAPFHYMTNTKDPQSLTTRYLYSTTPIGDARANFISRGQGADSSCVYVQKPSTGYVLLYRTTTVYMHLAEALNRLDEPELAFAVLKTGLHTGIAAQVDTAYTEEAKIPAENYYIPKASFDRLKSGSFPFFADAYKTNFTNTANKELVGIHARGGGAVEDIRSLYSYKSVVESRIDAIRAKFGVGSGAYTKEEYVNAVEDLLCDEYAMEFAFEGRRFSDLMRIARHKNQSGTYSANFGDLWFADKLKNKAALSSLQDAYLPFK